MSIHEIRVWPSDVRSDYAGYKATGDVKTDAFYSGLSSAVEKADGKGTGDILGLAMLPYSDMMSYGMKAQYSEKSTEEDPVIKITSNYGGEYRYYDVHVNEVNPKNASQIEMFALSCYMDDKGLTDGGSFGSYNKMKTYADNAAYNGMCPDLQNPDNISIRFDWMSVLKQMAQVYLGCSQTYQQYLNADSLADSFEAWSRKFDNQRRNAWTRNERAEVVLTDRGITIKIMTDNGGL